MKRRALTWNEKAACRWLARLKWNENDEFYPCLHNDTIMRVAQILLRGRNPAEFLHWLFESEGWATNRE